MTQNETSVNPDAEPAKPPVKKPVLAWAESKKTPRWLLCLAAVSVGWMPEQSDDAVDEVTEAEYDAAIAAAKDGYDAVAKAHGRAFVKALVHDHSLIAVVVRRLKSTEDTAVANLIAEASEAGDKAGADMLLRQFDNVVIYPPPAALAKLRDMAPKVLKLVFPRKWQGTLGAEVELSSKKQ